MQLTPDLYRRIAAAKVFIDGHYQQPIDLDAIAKRAFLSKYHFHRLFTRVYKKTPHAYVTQIRLEAAKVLLAKEGISITDVCHMVGFESLGSFSTLFSKRSGQSPQYYRHFARLKKKQEQEQPQHFVPHCFMEQYGIG